MGTLKKPTPEEMSELQRLRENRRLLDYFQSSLDQTKDSLIGTSDIDELRQLQGAAKQLTQLLRFITK